MKLNVYKNEIYTINCGLLNYLKSSHRDLYVKYNMYLDAVLTNDKKIFNEDFDIELEELKQSIKKIKIRERRKINCYELLSVIESRIKSFLDDYHFSDYIKNNDYFTFCAIETYRNELCELLWSDFLRTKSYEISCQIIKGESLLKLLKALYEDFSSYHFKENEEDFIYEIKVEGEF